MAAASHISISRILNGEQQGVGVTRARFPLPRLFWGKVLLHIFVALSDHHFLQPPAVIRAHGSRRSLFCATGLQSGSADLFFNYADFGIVIPLL